MTGPTYRRIGTALLAATLLLSACGGDADEGESADTEPAATSEPSETTAADTTAPTTDSTETTAADTTAPDGTTPDDATPPATDAAALGEFCVDLTALIDANLRFVSASSGDETVAAAAEMPDLAAAALASAPPDIADAMGLAEAYISEQATAIAAAGPDDAAALDAAVNLEADEATTAALGAILAYADSECGYAMDGMIPADAPEPPDCDVLDAAVAAEAAGADIDVTDSDGAGDFNLPGFATKSCSYGNGAMALSTISFIDLESILDDYVSNTENNGGEVLDTDLGSLPATSMVTEVAGATTVTVFEAPTPFSVGFSGGVAPEAIVAAAEALLAEQA